MVKLENIHKEMNNVQVQEAAHTLHFDWILDPFDIDDPFVKGCLKKMMQIRMGHEPTEDQLLAAERLFHTSVETGQAWSQ